MLTGNEYSRPAGASCSPLLQLRARCRLRRACTDGTFLGVTPPVPGTAGGIESNGSYAGKALTGKTAIAFMSLNNKTQMEFLAGDANASWWRDGACRGLALCRRGWRAGRRQWGRVRSTGGSRSLS